MRTLTRFMLLTVAVALIALFAIACSSGGDTDQTTSDEPTGETDGGTSGDMVSTDPLEVLSASAQNFQQEVESLQMEMKFAMNSDSFVLDSSSEMAFQAPDQMHMTMGLTGLGSFEVLMLGTDIYVNIPGQGWVIVSPEDLGLSEMNLDFAAFQDTLSNHSVVDYAAIIESLGGDIEDLGEETVDGGTYEHYRASMDLANLTTAFSDAFGATDALTGMGAPSGPLTFDVWVAPDTLLPYKLTASGDLTLGSEAMVLDASMLFTGYNEPVEIPGAPEDAVPFALLGGP